MRNGITKIETASQAAEALRPIAGDLTFALFAAGTNRHRNACRSDSCRPRAAYAVAEAFRFAGSLELPVGRALGFYGIVSAATLAELSVLLPLASILIAMLFWTAVINGIACGPDHVRGSC